MRIDDMRMTPAEYRKLAPRIQTKYTPEMAQKAYKILSEPRTLRPIRYVAAKLDISPDTFYRWMREHADFGECVERGLAEQENNAVQAMLDGDVNVKGMIFSLKNSSHRYKERAEADVSYRIDDLIIDHAKKGERMSWDEPRVIDVEEGTQTEQERARKLREVSVPENRLSPPPPTKTRYVGGRPEGQSVRHVG